jgi:hypothetical protein
MLTLNLEYDIDLYEITVAILPDSVRLEQVQQYNNFQTYPPFVGDVTYNGKTWTAVIIADAELEVLGLLAKELGFSQFLWVYTNCIHEVRVTDGETDPVMIGEFLIEKILSPSL